MYKYSFIIVGVFFAQLCASEKEPLVDIPVTVHAREKKDQPINLRIAPDATVGDLKKQLVDKQSVPLEQFILCAMPKEGSGSRLISPRLADDKPVKEVVEEFTAGFMLLKKPVQ